MIVHRTTKSCIMAAVIKIKLRDWLENEALRLNASDQIRALTVTNRAISPHQSCAIAVFHANRKPPCGAKKQKNQNLYEK